MNSCGHHHVGHIGILGVDKNGEEWYQISIGGNQGLTRAGAPASLGKVIGPSVARAQIPDVIEQLIGVYLGLRESDEERFIDVVWRAGIEPFKERVYDGHHQRQESSDRSLVAA
jgi:sulfite reductase (NADPH) hemoprotein beta-component